MFPARHGYKKHTLFNNKDNLTNSGLKHIPFQQACF